jgi:UDP-N-acetylmuramoyl-tripeptide--D-alanyl-D-alanine ligase
MDKFLVLFILLLFPGFIAIIRSLLKGLYLWQIKEFRLDRMLSYLKYERDYVHVDTLLTFVKIALTMLGIVYILFPDASYLSFSFFIAFIIYFLHLEWFLRDIVTKKLLRPRMRNTRVLIITTVMLTVIILLYARLFWWFGQFDFSNFTLETHTNLNISNFWESFQPTFDDGTSAIPILSLVAGASLLVNLLIDLTLPFWVLLLVLFTDPLSVLSRLRIIKKAERIIIARGDKLKIIAVTGSYGKTTTKEIIYEILSKKYKTVKTPENQNTAVGIAKSIIANVKEDTELFIAEMGAYKKGEISNAVKIAPPDVSLVTALSQQHLSLFGSLDNLFSAKYEIIEGLKDNGVAVLNGDDDGCMRMADMTNKSKFIFHYDPEHSHNNDTNDLKDSRNDTLSVSTVSENGEKLDIVFQYKQKSYSISVGFKDKRMALNLMASVGVCLQVGMEIDEVVEIINSFNYSGNYLKEYKGLNGSTVIDDGKSANYAGFEMALNYLSKKAQKKKWVMTQGIIELGSEKQKVYDKLAKEIVRVAQGLITNDTALAEAVKSNRPDYKIIFVKEPTLFPNYFNLEIKNGDVVLIEGTFAQNILKKIIIDAS